MKKMQMILSLLGIFCLGSLFPVSAGDPVPKSVTALASALEKDLPVWKLVSVRPLDDSIQRPFALGSWKLVFHAPRPPEAVDADPAGSAKAKKKYEMTLILLPLSVRIPKEELHAYFVWNKPENELFMKAHCLGKNKDWYAFVHSDVMTIDIMRNKYRFRGGDSIEETLADALNSTRQDIFSKREAVARLPRYGNAAIPAIRRAIGNALVEKLSLDAHFSALKALRTHEGNLELIRAVSISNPLVSETALNNLCTPPYPEEAKELYLKLLARHERVRECICALFVLQEEKRMLPILQNLISKPEDFREFFLISSSINRIRTGSEDIAEMHYAGQIRLLMAHSGDVEGTPRIIPISDKTSMRQIEFAEEDMRRTKPLEEALVNSPNTEMAILAVLTLCNFEGTKGGTRFSRDYTIRVRNAGLRILRRLPQKAVKRNLACLKNVRSPELADYFRYIDEACSNRKFSGIPERARSAQQQKQEQKKIQKK